MDWGLLVTVFMFAVAFTSVGVSLGRKSKNVRTIIEITYEGLGPSEASGGFIVVTFKDGYTVRQPWGGGP